LDLLMTLKLLYQLDTDATPSVFDSVVAYDGGADHVIGHANITASMVGPLVEGAIYTRGPKEKQYTALFIGGSNIDNAEAVLQAVRSKFFGKFSVSVMLDANGCNTTAAAAVALLGKSRPLTGATALVLAGTGPVGSRAAAMLALEGAHVTITGRSLEKTQAAAASITKRFGVTIKAIAAPDASSRHAAVQTANIVLAAGAAGHELAEANAWQNSPLTTSVADLNPEPPLGLGGIGVADKAKDYHGKLAFGALGIGGLKLKLHRACIARLFTAHDQILDAETILTIAKEMA
jgi:hypothetical protein